MTNFKSDLNQVIKAVVTERAYQEDKWSNPSMSAGDCLHYMRHHLRKAEDAFSTSECVGVCDTVMDQIRKITALGVALGEEHGMPPRPGYGFAYLFTAGDIIMLDDEKIYQCICSDIDQAVFGPCTISKEGLLTIYQDLFVVYNQPNPKFQFTRVSQDDIRRITQNLT
jgi:hypothetical protein